MEVVNAILVWLRAHEGPQHTKEERSHVRLLREKAIDLIGNRSYETGLPCDSGAAIRFADTVWSDQNGITKSP
jgi:hypothetical protein